MGFFDKTLILSEKDYDFPVMEQTKQLLIEMGFAYQGEEFHPALDMNDYNFIRGKTECRIQCEILRETELIAPKLIIKEFIAYKKRSDNK